MVTISEATEQYPHGTEHTGTMRNDTGSATRVPVPSEQRTLVDMAAEHAVLCLVEMFDTAWATLLLLDSAIDPTGPYVRYRATREEAGASFERRAHRESFHPLWAEVLATADVVEGDAAAQPDVSGAVKSFGIRAYLAISVRTSSEGLPLGVFFLNRDRSIPFTAHERTVARRLADRVARMIERAREEARARAHLDAERVRIEREHAEFGRAESAHLAAEAGHQRLVFLARASTILASSLDVENTLQDVARLAVPLLGDWCAVNLREDHGSIRRVAVAHADPAKEHLTRELAVRFPLEPNSAVGTAVAMRTEKTVIRSDVNAELLEQVAPDPEYARLLRAIGVRSSLHVPLKARGRTLGTLSFVAGDSGRRFEESDLPLYEELADHIAVAVDNALLYQQLQEAVLARDQLLSVVSHELRTPVAHIKGYAQFLRRSFERGETRLDRMLPTFKRIDEATRRMDKLTADLLDASRLRAKDLLIHREPVDIAEVVQTVVAQGQARLGMNHTIVLESERQPLMLRADQGRLEQVIENLLDNAAKYSPDGGNIFVALASDNSGISLSVRDEGIGLPAPALDIIFEPFDRAPNAEARYIAGIGLGLYICRAIIQQHGGRIWAESAGEGTGTTMRVWLPR